MVSIIPGMDTRAPERTDTRSGRSRSPKRASATCSSRSRCSTICSQRPSGHLPPARREWTQAWVVTVKPGGTGMPRLVISASSQPFPPRRFRITDEPSARPAPKK